MIGSLLLDNSAWSRLSCPLPDDRRKEISSAVQDGRMHVCLPFLLEAGYSTRSGRDHRLLIEELLALPRVWVTERVEERALEAQAQLATVGHHRVPPVDLLIAALADVHHLGVLHYDGDFDMIAERTDLRFESVWLVERGTL